MEKVRSNQFVDMFLFLLRDRLSIVKEIRDFWLKQLSTRQFYLLRWNGVCVREREEREGERCDSLSNKPSMSVCQDSEHFSSVLSS